MMNKDQELIVEYYEGNREALEELFSRYKKKIFNYCLRFLDNELEAEDAAADIFRSLSVKDSFTQSQVEFSVWIYRIARHYCLIKRRKRKRFLRSRLEAGPAGFSYRRGEEPAYVKKAISRLPLSYQEIVILRHYQGLNYSEIAKVLGISPEKVKFRLFRTRQKLKRYLQPILSEVGGV